MASILLVAEQAGAHERLRSALVIAGHDVVVTGRPPAAGRYDLALVDCAADAASDVVAQASRRARRVVLCSNAPEGELRARAERTGATGYLAPGSTAQALLAQLHAWLERRGPA